MAIGKRVLLLADAVVVRKAPRWPDCRASPIL